MVLNRNPSNVVKSLTVENSNPTENLKESDEDKEKKIVKLGSLSAEERAKLRAQKFGVPIPESIKKAERAERFGVAKNAPAASVNKTANTKVSCLFKYNKYSTFFNQTFCFAGGR